MSDLSLQELDEINPDEHPDPDLIKRLRNTAKSKVTERQQFEKATRELAFRRAGVDVDTRMGKLLMDGWTDSLDDLDAIRGAWNELPKATPPAADPAPADAPAAASTPPQDPAPAPAPANAEPPAPTGTAERQALAADAPPAGLTDPMANRNAVNAAVEAHKKGATWDDAAGFLANQLINNVVNGSVPPLTRDGMLPGRSRRS